MSLLDEVVADSLDPSFVAAARRRAAQDNPSSVRRRLSRLLTVVAVAGIGLVLALGGNAASAGALSAGEVREDLITEIERQFLAVDELRRHNEQIRAELAELRRAALSGPARTEDQNELLARIDRLEAAAAAVPVEGRGITIEVRDAPFEDEADFLEPRPEEDDVEVRRVGDRDLQALVNGLFAAGAEGVAVGDYRLTSLSAIRSAGEAVLVDYQPVLPPYTISAIGEPATLEEAVMRGEAGEGLRVLRDTEGVTFDVRRGLQRLPGAGSFDALRYASYAGEPILSSRRPESSESARGRGQ